MNSKNNLVSQHHHSPRGSLLHLANNNATTIAYFQQTQIESDNTISGDEEDFSVPHSRMNSYRETEMSPTRGG